MEKENPQIRMLLFYAISIVLSLITVVVAATVFIVIVYLHGTVTASFLLLFILIVAANGVIMAISLRRIIMLYPFASSSSGTPRIIYMRREKSNEQLSGSQTSRDQIEKHFTGFEVEIIDLLRKNGSRMLQNSITASLPVSKATVSRSLTSLENKGAIMRIRKGVTNEVILTETYSE